MKLHVRRNILLQFYLNLLCIELGVFLPIGSSFLNCGFQRLFRIWFLYDRIHRFSLITSFQTRHLTITDLLPEKFSKAGPI